MEGPTSFILLWHIQCLDLRFKKQDFNETWSITWRFYLISLSCDWYHIIHASCLISSPSLLVSCVGCWAMWAENGHRAVPAGGSGGGVGEERVLLQEQCSPPVALHHLWPPRARSQEVLRQILHWVSGSHEWVASLRAPNTSFKKLLNFGHTRINIDEYFKSVINQNGFSNLRFAAFVCSLNVVLTKQAIWRHRIGLWEIEN